MKKGIFAAILAVLTIISVVSNSFAVTENSDDLPQETTAEVQIFKEPKNLDWKVRSHNRISFWCPENADSSKIRQKINSTGDFLYQLVSDKEIQEFLNECNEGSFFYFKGLTLNSEIESCFNNFANALPQVDFSTNPKMRNEVIKECYIRDYFNQTFNDTSLDNSSNETKDSLLDARAREFIDLMNYEIAHSDERPVPEERPASLPVNDTGRDLINISCKREFGDECNNQTPNPDVGPEQASAEINSNNKNREETDNTSRVNNSVNSDYGGILLVNNVSKSSLNRESYTEINPVITNKNTTGQGSKKEVSITKSSPEQKQSIFSRFVRFLKDIFK